LCETLVGISQHTDVLVVEIFRVKFILCPHGKKPICGRGLSLTIDTF